MKIVDTNILNKFLKGEILLDLSEQFYTTENLRDEVETLELMLPEYKDRLQKIFFKNIEKHNYFSEAKYIESYKKFINKYNGLVSFYGLKGLGDISILAGVETISKPIYPSLFESANSIEIITHDEGLKNALKEEFNGRVIISDPGN